jgi:hypothetical protein
MNTDKNILINSDNNNFDFNSHIKLTSSFNMPAKDATDVRYQRFDRDSSFIQDQVHKISF